MCVSVFVCAIVRVLVFSQFYCFRSCVASVNRCGVNDCNDERAAENTQVCFAHGVYIGYIVR